MDSELAKGAGVVGAYAVPDAFGESGWLVTFTEGIDVVDHPLVTVRMVVTWLLIVAELP